MSSLVLGLRVSREEVGDDAEVLVARVEDGRVVRTPDHVHLCPGDAVRDRLLTGRVGLEDILIDTEHHAADMADLLSKTS